jgi:hypothetical protein
MYPTHISLGINPLPKPHLRYSQPSTGWLCNPWTHGVCIVADFTSVNNYLAEWLSSSWRFLLPDSSWNCMCSVSCCRVTGYSVLRLMRTEQPKLQVEALSAHKTGLGLCNLTQSHKLAYFVVLVILHTEITELNKWNIATDILRPMRGCCDLHTQLRIRAFMGSWIDMSYIGKCEAIVGTESGIAENGVVTTSRDTLWLILSCFETLHHLSVQDY